MPTIISGDSGITFPDATTQSKAVSQATPFAVTASAGAGAELQLPEATANGVNYVGLKAPNALAANTTFTLPSADGTNGQFLQTNGSGTLTFATVAPAGAMTLISTQTASNSANITWTGLSGYDRYMLVLSNVVPTSGSYSLFLFQVGTGAGPTYVTSASYNSQSSTFTTTYSGSIDSGTTSGYLGYYVSNAVLAGNHMVANISGMLSGNVAIMSTSCQMGQPYRFATEATVSAGAAVTALKLNPNVGNFSSGTFTLYGLS